MYKTDPYYALATLLNRLTNRNIPLSVDTVYTPVSALKRFLYVLVD